jgi:hypothetical protein
MILYLVPAIIFNWWKIVVCGTCGTLGFKFASMSYILQKKQSKEIAQRQESDIIKIKEQILDKIFHFPETVCPHETGDHFFVWELETM